MILVGCSRQRQPPISTLQALLMVARFVFRKFRTFGTTYWKAGRQLEATFQWQHALAQDPPEADIDRIKEKLAVGLDEVERRELASEKEANKG